MKNPTLSSEIIKHVQNMKLSEWAVIFYDCEAEILDVSWRNPHTNAWGVLEIGGDDAYYALCTGNGRGVKMYMRGPSTITNIEDACKTVESIFLPTPPDWHPAALSNNEETRMFRPASPVAQ